MGRLEGGADHPGLYSPPHCVSWATQEVGQVGFITGEGVGWRWREAFAFLAGLASPFQTSELTGGRELMEPASWRDGRFNQLGNLFPKEKSGPRFSSRKVNPSSPRRVSVPTSQTSIQRQCPGPQSWPSVVSCELTGARQQTTGLMGDGGVPLESLLL